MTFFRVAFFPPPGERNSPYETLLELDEPRRTAILTRLEDFERLEYIRWPRQWSKKHTGPLCQLRKGPYRVMYALDPPYLVVVHIFRKHGQKTVDREINIALRNFEQYLAWSRR